MEELFRDDTWTVFQDSASLPDGRVKRVSRVKRADSVHIIAFDADANLLLLREYRPFYQSYIWMLPSGHVDKESDHAIAAQRELQEETGFRAEHIEFLWSSRPSESLDFESAVYTARTLSSDPLPQDDDELIEVHHLPFSEALDNVLNSPVVHTLSAYALLRYARENNLS